MPAARVAATLFGCWTALLAAAVALAPAARIPLGLLAGLSAAAAVGCGLRLHQPADRQPWHLLAAAVGLAAVGGAAGAQPDSVTRAVPGIDIVGNLLLLAAYPTLAAALLVLIRRRSERAAPDRAALLDTVTVTAGAALLCWTFLVGPRLPGSFSPGSFLTGSLWAPAAALGGLLCLGMLVRLLLAPGRRVIADNLLAAGVLALLATDVAQALGLVAGDTPFAAAPARLALGAAAGLAALHPAMSAVSRPAGAPAAELTRGRLVLLGVAAMVAPVVLLVRPAPAGGPAGLAVVGVLSAAVTLLVLVRMSGITASYRLALTRERALREASAALVSAADTDAVNDAVRTAVSHLLPAGTPHGVVLAVAIAQDGPLSPEATEQAALDRAAGTAARRVATRDVDWAVAVRLSQFPATLRCPMVLTDRPTGDPLVGVLHVAAPPEALAGLHRAVEVLAGQVALALERIGLSQEVIRRNSETYFRTLVQNTADVILIVDEQDRIRYASPSAASVFGAGDPTGVLLPQMIHPVDRARLADVLAAVRAGDGLQEGLDFRATGNRRTPVLLEMHCRDLRTDLTVAGLVITLRDVTESRRLQQELIHQAFHDSMTGLANRVLFHDRLRHALARGARDGSVVGVLFIDLDDFKIVNDTLGHAAGDQLLVGVAQRIAGALRADDTAARLGGDEFAALVENVQDPGAVEETAQRILTALAEPIALADGGSITAVASIGITTTPEADSAEELLRQADLALYVAKGAGKNQWRRYQAHLHGAMVERLELRSALDHAMREGQFLLAYQPIVDLRTEEPVGFEALVRWHHPAKGVVAPAEFIEVAEESGLIVPMGRWVLEQALHTVAQWRRILPRARRPYVSVNVSVRQFREPGFVDVVKQALVYAGVPPEALMIELTETLLAGDHEAIWQDLAVLREHGVRVAIDDFGTGYSSLGYLRRRPIDVVKIDKTFIDDMVESPHQLALVTGIVSLARSLDLTVVAEGIETARHRDLLVGLGCELGQGYHYASPVDATEALSRMTATQPLAA